MLTPHDAELCRRDRALPGLRVLLDADTFVSLIRDACPDRAIASARPTYLRYKPGLSCLAAYTLAVEGEEVMVHAHAYAGDSREKYSKLTGPDEVVRGELGRGHMLLPEHGLVVSVFPNDRKLKALRRLATAEGLARLLYKLDPGLDVRAARLRVLSYKPERRMVARLDVNGRPRAVVRTYTEAAYEVARHNARAFASGGTLRIAGYLAKSDWQQTLALEYLEGKPLNHLICGDAYAGPSVVLRVAEALAELHAQVPNGVLLQVPRDQRRQRLSELAEWIGFLLPDLSRRAGELACALVDGLATVALGRGFAHGDFYASQVLIEERSGIGGGGGCSVAVLDLDEAREGDPYTDLASFAAHLASDAIGGHVPRDRVGPLVASFNEHYARVTRRPLPRHLPLYTAIAIFRLMPHPFRRRETDWPARTAALLDGVQETLKRS